jgi:replicative DNA helicase
MTNRRSTPVVEAIVHRLPQPPPTPEPVWEPPVSLGQAGDALPEFPLHALPVWAAEYAEAAAVATQTPKDLAGVLALTAFATAAGGRALVEVRPGWVEPLNLYAAVALPPGARKTPIFNRITAPIVDAEREAAEAAAPVIAEAAARRKAAEELADQAQAEAARAGQQGMEEALQFAVAMRLAADAIAVPRPPRLLADDTSAEALTSLLAEQGGRIAVLSDEGEIFEVMAGRYSKGGAPNLGVFLKGHAGSAIRVDRKGRGFEQIEAPALTIGLAVQPTVFEEIAKNRGFRGRGLLARFLYAMPPSNVGSRTPGSAPERETVTACYRDHLTILVRSLADLHPEPAVIPFTKAADERLLAFEFELEPRLGPRGDLGHVADWASKLAGHTARIAGLLHLATNIRTNWGQPVAAATVDAAVTVARYFIAHAIVVFDVMAADPEFADARELVPWITGRDSFSRRDVHRAHSARFPKATDLDPALALLEEHGWIRQQAAPDGRGRGRPPSPVYDVNPLIIR